MISIDQHFLGNVFYVCFTPYWLWSAAAVPENNHWGNVNKLVFRIQTDQKNQSGWWQKIMTQCLNVGPNSKATQWMKGLCSCLTARRVMVQYSVFLLIHTVYFTSMCMSFSQALHFFSQSKKHRPFVLLDIFSEPDVVDVVCVMLVSVVACPGSDWRTVQGVGCLCSSVHRKIKHQKMNEWMNGH